MTDLRTYDRKRGYKRRENYSCFTDNYARCRDGGMIALVSTVSVVVALSLIGLGTQLHHFWTLSSTKTRPNTRRVVLSLVFFFTAVAAAGTTALTDAFTAACALPPTYTYASGIPKRILTPVLGSLVGVAALCLVIVLALWCTDHGEYRSLEAKDVGVQTDIGVKHRPLPSVVHPPHPRPRPVPKRTKEVVKEPRDTLLTYFRKEGLLESQTQPVPTIQRSPREDRVTLHGTVCEERFFIDPRLYNNV